MDEVLNDLRGASMRSVHRDDSVIITGAEYLRKSRITGEIEHLLKSVEILSREAERLRLFLVDVS